MTLLRENCIIYKKKRINTGNKVVVVPPVVGSDGLAILSSFATPPRNSKSLPRLSSNPTSDRSRKRIKNGHH